MEQFILSPERFRKVRRQMLTRMLIMGTLVISAVCIMQYLRDGFGNNPVIQQVVFLVIAPLAICIGFSIALKRQRAIYESYRLNIDLLTISREQHNTQTVSIPMNDVQSISEDRRGNLIIRSSTPLAIIVVPAQLQDRHAFLQLAARNNWPVGVEDVSGARKLLLRYLPVIFIAMFVLFNITKNKALIAVLGTCMTVGLVYSLVVTLRHRSIDNQTKRTSWIVIIVLLSVVASTILRLLQ